VTEQEEFWTAIWDYFDLQASQPFSRMLGSTTMPGAQWLTGARLNYADQVLRRADQPGAAIVSVQEDGTRTEVSWTELAAAVSSFAATLRRLGVTKGDRVVGYLTNGPEAIIAMLGTAAIGAIWAGVGPDYGVNAAADRLAQLRPSVLVAVTGYQFAGQIFDRRAEVAELGRRLGSELPVVVTRRCGLEFDAGTAEGEVIEWDTAISQTGTEPFHTEPSAVGALLLRDHRHPEGDHARSRRDPAGTHGLTRVPERIGQPIRLLLVHDDELDDVELRRLRAADRFHHRRLRGQPRLP
jgi:hypothetical protein